MTTTNRPRKDHVIHARVSAETSATLHRIADEQDCTVADLVRRALKIYEKKGDSACREH